MFEYYFGLTAKYKDKTIQQFIVASKTFGMIPTVCTNWAKSKRSECMLFKMWGLPIKFDPLTNLFDSQKQHISGSGNQYWSVLFSYFSLHDRSGLHSGIVNTFWHPMHYIKFSGFKDCLGCVSIDTSVMFCCYFLEDFNLVKDVRYPYTKGFAISVIIDHVDAIKFYFIWWLLLNINLEFYSTQNWATKSCTLVGL